ncbi:MAG: hypothetical protein H0W72_10845 [Planctomycetes bacterium]|nr:hypothetical protein [Planctomycetota bacterium]
MIARLGSTVVGLIGLVVLLVPTVAAATLPTLTTIQMLTNRTEDTPVSISYNALKAMCDESSDTTFFEITEIVSGSLSGYVTVNGKMRAVGGSTPTTLVWTPPSNAHGLMTAFRLVAGNTAGVSVTPVDVIMSVNSVNDVPTLGPITIIAGQPEDLPTTLTYDQLAAATQASDADGDTISFQVTAVWGTITGGGLPRTIAPGGSFSWEPLDNANGTILAYQLRAFDGVATSAVHDIRITVPAVNDPPVIDLFPAGDLAYPIGSGSLYISPGVTVSDVEGTYQGSKLEVWISAGAAIGDALNLGSSQVTVDGANLKVSGNIVGTTTLDASVGGQTFSVFFSNSANVTPLRIAEVIRAVSFRSDGVDRRTRTVSWKWSEPDETYSLYTRRVVLNLTPVIEGDRLIVIARDGSSPIGSDSLWYSDDSSPVGIQYSVSAEPAGALRLSGVRLAFGDTFTPGDIQAGRLTYDGSGLASASDTFSVRLSDGELMTLPTPVNVQVGTDDGAFRIISDPPLYGASTLTSSWTVRVRRPVGSTGTRFAGFAPTGGFSFGSFTNNGDATETAVLTYLRPTSAPILAAQGFSGRLIVTATTGTTVVSDVQEFFLFLGAPSGAPVALGVAQ